MLRRLEMVRCAWKQPIAPPAAMQERRLKFLQRRTGPQLALLCRRVAGKLETSESDLALLDAWLRLGPQFAVARRVFDDCAASAALAPKSLLAVGAGAATVAAFREAFPEAARARIVAVEKTEAHVDAARELLGGDGDGVEWHASLGAVAVGHPSPERSFDVVVAARHLSAVPRSARETHLAILSACVREAGILALVEDGDDARVLGDARRALLGAADEEMTVLGPCPHDLPTEDHLPPVFAQAARRLGGPPLRSIRKANAGTVVATRNQATMERFSYLALKRGPRAADPETVVARVLKTPLKRHGHVVIDVCTSDGTTERLTLSKAALEHGGGATYKEARKLTAGSLLRYSRVS